MFNKLFLLSFACLWFAGQSHSQIVINEYSCSNLSSVADNFGDYEDWVELYNTTSSPVNLNGYYLSDKLSDPTKWQLGSVTINANGFLRIWASGRNIKTGTNIHAGFKLTQCKPEDIVLANASGTVIDSQTLKPAQVGHSRGRTTNGGATWGVFTTPTPGASNANAQQEYATKPTMSVAAGFYSGTQNVTISSPDPNITIRYTTNGTTPTTGSTLYSSPVTVSATTVLRAKAFSSTATIPASFIESNTYFINANHTVEVISVFGNGITAWLTNPPPGPVQPKFQGGIEYFDKTGAFKTESYGEINKHGNDSWSYKQRGIDFVSQDEYGYNYALLHPIFNSKSRSEFQRLIIKASAGDNYPFETPGSSYAWGPNSQLGGCHIRDQYVHTLSQKAGLHLDERTWAPAVLYVNGAYWGLYDSREKVDDADFTDYYHDADSYFQNNEDQDSLQFLKDWGGVWAEYGGNTALSEWAALRNYVTSNNMAVQANYDYVDSQLNIKSFVDYFFINTVTVCKDWLNYNTAWWRGKQVKSDKKKWRYTLWDVDATFDHYVNYTGIPSSGPNADPCDSQNLNPQGGDEGHLEILNDLLANPGFKQYYVMRYFDLMQSGLSCSRMITVFDSMIAVIRPEMPAQIARWNSFTPGRSYTEWDQNVTDMRNFIQARCLSVVNSYTPCNGVTAIFPIKVNAVPAGAGTVDVNSINVSSFIWTASYPGATPPISMNFTAHPNPGYCFDHWEFQNHTPLPSTLDSAVSIGLSATDSIVAVFSLGGSASVTATQSTIFCGDSSQLQCTGGSSFIWSPSAGLSNTTIANPVAAPSVTTTYSVITSGQCGTDTTSITITVSTVTTASVTASTTSIPCGTSTTLSAAGGNAYVWSPSQGLSNTTGSSPVATPTLSTTYTVIVSSACGSDTTSIAISVLSASSASVTAASTTLPCGGSTNLQASGGITYEWSPAAGLSNTTIANPVANPSITTTYSVVAFSSCGSDTAVITITVNSGANASVSAAAPGICIGESTTLLVNGGAVFTWSPSSGLSNPNISNPVATPTATTTYSVMVSDACGADTGMVTVTVEDPPVPSVSGDMTICSSEAAELSASGGANYVWSPPTGLSCVSCSNPSAAPPVTTTYIVSVSSAKNCSAADTVTVFVSGECPEIYVPTGFSPNGDNNNDILYVFGVMDDLHFVIYNRWGQIVFETTDKLIGWDGTHHGKLVQSGIYAYKFTATDPKGTVVKKSGNITVIR